MRVIRFLFLSSLIILPLAGLPGSAEAKYASIVIEADTGRVLHAVNADTRNYPASLTKMMTLFMTFEALRAKKISLSQKLRVSRRAQSRPPSKLGLRAGERISVRDAISALVVKSANDVATVVAEALGGTERKFARQMTRRARQLGMRNTTFTNASGLPSRAQLSTARDMATLSRKMLETFPRMYGQFSRKTWIWRGRTYRNHNRLLQNYRGMDGIKTGYTRASGFNLAASAERGGRRLIAVVFGGRTSKSRNRIVARLLNRGFSPAEIRKAAKIEAARSASVAASARRAALTPKPLAAGSAGPAGVQIATATAGPGSAIAPVRNRRAGAVRGWTVQVGAFARLADARKMIGRAVQKVPSLAGQPYKIVNQKRKTRRGGRIYKARLVMASRSSARNSCRLLKRRKIDCLVVWMSSRS